MPIKCFECNEVRGLFRSRFEQHICKGCFASPKYTLVTKTNCKKIYNLTEDDLCGLVEYQGKCAYGDATYYTKDAIIHCSCVKHNTTPEDLENTLLNIKLEREHAKEAKRQQRTQKEQMKQEKRRYKLLEALNKAGLDLRNDSVLCQQYMNGTSDYSLDYIVRRMSQMKFLFDYCHMDECRDIAYEEHTDELQNGYFPDCSVFDRAEDIALSKYSNGRYPDNFPWRK